VPVLNALLETDAVAAADASEVTELIAELEELTTAEVVGGPPPDGDVVRDEWGRAPWVGWRDSPVGSLTHMSSAELGELICQVVEDEGPVQVARVYDLLRAAAGFKRTGRVIRSALDRALRRALREGDLVAYSPTDPDPLRRVLRHPTQPDIILRQSGDRDARTIPANELQELARIANRRRPDADRDALKRLMAELLGWKRYTRQLDELLDSVVPTRPPTPGSAAVGNDALRSLAERVGVVAAYDEFLRVAEVHGLGVRRWPKSVTLTPPSNRRSTLVYIAPREEGTLDIGWSPENFDQFLGITEDQVLIASGDVHRSHDVVSARAAATRLDTLLRVGQLDEPFPTNLGLAGDLPTEEIARRLRTDAGITDAVVQGIYRVVDALNVMGLVVALSAIIVGDTTDPLVEFLANMKPQEDQIERIVNSEVVNPLEELAKELGAPEDMANRALAFAQLTSIITTVASRFAGRPLDFRKDVAPITEGFDELLVSGEIVDLRWPVVPPSTELALEEWLVAHIDALDPLGYPVDIIERPRLETPFSLDRGKVPDLICRYREDVDDMKAGDLLVVELKVTRAQPATLNLLRTQIGLVSASHGPGVSVDGLILSAGATTEAHSLLDDATNIGYLTLVEVGYYDDLFGTDLQADALAEPEEDS
jgi:hypothetical protein